MGYLQPAARAFLGACWPVQHQTQGMGTTVGTCSSWPHLPCCPLQLLLDVGEEESVEAVFISPSQAQPSDVVLEEGKRRHVPGAVGGAALGTRRCQALGTQQGILVDAEPVVPAQLPNDLGSQSACWHSPHTARGWQHRHPQHLTGVPVGVTL